MNATPPGGEPRQDSDAAAPETGQETLSPNQARQGEIIFAKSGKRNVFFAVVIPVAVMGLVLIVAFT